MLIEFSVSNFKSIRARQTLSLTASKLKESDALKQNCFSNSTVTDVALLRSCAIYGPNASGKTNLLLALRQMSWIVEESATKGKQGDELPVAPFSLDVSYREAPTEFEVIFVSHGVRYQFGFSATKERIIEEWLIAFPKGRAQHWYARQWDKKKKDYRWKIGSSLLGQKQLWMESTRSNALFLTTSIQLNSQQMFPVYDWFHTTLRMAGIRGLGPEITVSLCKDQSYKARVLDFLKAADIDIDDLIIKKKQFDSGDLPDNIPDSIRSELCKKLEGKEIIDQLNTVHRDNTGMPVKFDLDDESEGTRRLFSFAGPWLDTLEKGYVLFVDELHDNLHPKLVQFLVRLFHSDKTNPKNAQLVFTTHETSILSGEIFRRDQIWFCEKDKTQATKLYSLTDFSHRTRENLEMAYMAGRFGALPFTRELAKGSS